jgi:hypothetical protein
VAVFCLYAKAYALSYGDTVLAPDGRHRATYLGSQVRIDDTPVKVLTVIAMKWTGDANTLAIVEHLAGGSQLALVHLIDDKWKRFEVEPPITSYDNISVVSLTVRKRSVTVKYKLTQRHNREVRFYVCSFDVAPVTQAYSKEITKEVTAQEYENLSQLTSQAGIKTLQ